VIEIKLPKSGSSTPPIDLPEDMPVSVEDNFDSIFKTQGQQVKEITACPHTNRRHYAKVRFFYHSFRTCVLLVIANMAEIRTPTTAFTRTDSYTRKANVNLATYLTTTR